MDISERLEVGETKRDNQSESRSDALCVEEVSHSLNSSKSQLSLTGCADLSFVPSKARPLMLTPIVLRRTSKFGLSPRSVTQGK